MKKIIAMVTSLVVIVTIFTMPVSVLASNVIDLSNMTLSLERTEYEETEIVTVILSGVTDTYNMQQVIIEIYRVGVAEHLYANQQRFRITRDLPGNKRAYEFYAPGYGIWEFRAYYENFSKFIVSPPFSVGGASSSAPITLSLDKTSYDFGEKIIVTTSGVTEEMVTNEAFVAICGIGTETRVSEMYYPKAGTDQLVVEYEDLEYLKSRYSPPEYSYGVRLYINDQWWDNESFVTSIPIPFDTTANDDPPHDTTEIVPQEAPMDGINVMVNGTYIIFDQSPIIENGRTLVPLRAIFEALGAEVEWKDDTQTVTAVRGSTTISLQIGSNILINNGVSITLDIPAQLINGRTLVPARAVAESFGADVDWDPENQTVVITD